MIGASLAKATAILMAPWVNALTVLTAVLLVLMLFSPFLPGIVRWWRQRRNSN